MKIEKFTSYVEAIMYLESGKPLHDLNNDELDFLYHCCFGRRAYHLTRQAYIDSIRVWNTKREQDQEKIRKEAIQSAAMLLRLITELT